MSEIKGWVVSETIGVTVINPRVYGPAVYYKEKLETFQAQQSSEEEMKTFLQKEIDRYPHWSNDLYQIIDSSFPKFHYLLKLFPFT